MHNVSHSTSLLMDVRYYVLHHEGHEEHEEDLRNTEQTLLDPLNRSVLIIFTSRRTGEAVDTQTLLADLGHEIEFLCRGLYPFHSTMAMEGLNFDLQETCSSQNVNITLHCTPITM